MPRTTGSIACGSSSTGTQLQSDRTTEEILALGDLAAKLRAFGWMVETCDGHDHAALRDVFGRFREGGDAPKALIAETIKGKGVSFMEHPTALVEGGGPLPVARRCAGGRAVRARARRARPTDRRRYAALGLEPPTYEPAAPPADVRRLEGEPESGAGARRAPVTDEYVVEAYGDELVELAGRHEQLVVLDADLASDCRVRAFELAYPERFLECGIAEQDMVSAAAGLARHGFLPVVNSFASFLGSRANEQIYNQASERTKVVYALHYAGLVPAGPGKSHQSVRDISLLGALPDLTIVQPGSAEETRVLLRWAVDEADGSVAIRLAIGPSPRGIDSPAEAAPGVPQFLRDGEDALLVSYGPVMLHEALTAAEILAKRDVAVAVANMPWLNRIEAAAPSADMRTSSSSRTTPRSAGSVTPFGAQASRPRCTASRAGPPAAPPPRPFGPWARRRVGRRSHRGVAGVSDRRVWVVLPDLLSIRVFFDTGIVDGLRERLAGAIACVFLVSDRAAAAWVGRLEDTLAPGRGALGDRRRPRRARLAAGGRVAGRADRLLPARHPPEPPPRVPRGADARRTSQLDARLRAGRMASELAHARARHGALVLQLAPPRARSSARDDALGVLRARRRERPAPLRPPVPRCGTPTRTCRSSPTSRAGTTPSARA